MFLKKDKKKDGRTYLSIVKGFRDPATGKTRSKTILSLGYLEDLSDQFDDPIAHFTELAREMTEKEQEKHQSLSLSLGSQEKIAIGANRKNIGFLVLAYFYHGLALPNFWSSRQRTMKTDFELNQIFEALVYLHTLQPASVRITFEALDQYFFSVDFELPDIYQTLSFFVSCKEDLIIYLGKQVRSRFDQDLEALGFSISNPRSEISCVGDFEKQESFQKGFELTDAKQEARPAFVSQEVWMEAHLLIDFVSQLLMRLLVITLGEKGMSSEAAIREMQSMTGTYLGHNYYMFDHYNENVKALGDIIGVDFFRRFLTQQEIRNMISSVKR